MVNAGYRFTIHNEKYTAVLTGRTVKILRRGSKEELARFRDLKHARFCVFNPVKNMLATKSIEPWIAFYCLDTMKLLRAIEIEKPVYIETLSKYGYATMHESGFCFSHDGKSLLNIETVISVRTSDNPGCVTHLVEYDCETFAETARHFSENTCVFRVIERHEDGYLLSGTEYKPSKTHWESVNFIAFFDGKALTKKRELSPEEFNEISPYSEIYYQ
ncbi:MAG: hypothetical protein FWB88_01380 [Defluviitaleaceae bacterium]|nr:hypothetical protein [Defluviitaleaceae bacterium]MCL2238953.1 hypothetical protein [Defluviitaleaceae bacterium]MCL2240602.1 hypothetical protein [Defluviitaleaceae bacterium]